MRERIVAIFGSVFNCQVRIVIIILLRQVGLAQNYDYAKYLEEKKLDGKIYSLTQMRSYDSISYYLSKYDTRLGYKYYYYRAVGTNKKSSESIKYLDTAFRRGMGIICMGSRVNLFDSAVVRRSFERNYLKDYDEKYINDLQGMEEQDQKYRKIIVGYEDKLKTPLNIKEGSYNRDTVHFTPEQKVVKEIIDSLYKLQEKIDSVNFSKLNKLIAEKGWPSAKLIGLPECNTYMPPSPSVLVMHLGTEQRDYQINNLQRVIKLCLKNEESWQNAEFLIFNIYNRFRKQYSEFSFLEIKNNKVSESNSFFALYQMSELLIKKSTEVIEIKCRDEKLFNTIRLAMLKINKQIPIVSLQKLYLEIGRQRPEYLSSERFRFVQDRTMDKDKVFFRFITQ